MLNLVLNDDKCETNDKNDMTILLHDHQSDWQHGCQADALPTMRLLERNVINAAPDVIVIYQQCVAVLPIAMLCFA